MHACWMTILVIHFWKIFEGKLSIITRPTCPIEMIFEFMLKSQVGVIRKIYPDVCRNLTVNQLAGENGMNGRLDHSFLNDTHITV